MLSQYSYSIYIYRSISYLSFILYLAATLFGASGPQWPTKLEDISDMSTSNPINQVVFSTIFILSFISLLPRYKTVLNLLNKEKYIVFFFLWCGITMLWSVDFLISFKRYFQYLTTSIVFISVLVNFQDEQTILKPLKYLFRIYVLVTLAVVLVVPQATDPTFNTWRGLHPTKNNLGQTAAISILIFYYFTSKSSDIKDRMINLMFLFLGFVLLLGSFSMTNVLIISFFLIFLLIASTGYIFSKIGIGKKLVQLILAAAAIIIFLFIFLASDLIVMLFEIVGRDPTLTGRTEIWVLVLAQSRDSLLTGVGFQAFWIPETMAGLTLFQYWIPTQSHNGFVDIILETGIIGLTFFVLMVINSLRKITFNVEIIWVLLIVYALILNISESTLIRPGHPSNVFFYMSFWAISFNKYFLNRSNEVT